MAWILESIIGEIYEAYRLLPGGRESLPVDEQGKPLLGNIEKARNADAPRVIWVLQGGNFGDAKLAASAPAPSDDAPPEQPTPHYQALARFWVWIWQVDKETCWNVMVDLLAAMRSTIYGPNLGPQNFQCPTEVEGRDMQRGDLIVLDVVLSVPIPRDGTVPVEEVAIKRFDGNVRTRADLLGLESVPTPAPDLDLVVVTNDDVTDD
jgi:hypothetical protein